MKSRLTLLAGEFGDIKSLRPPEHSWAFDPANCVNIYFIQMLPGDRIQLEICLQQVNRSIHILECDQFEVDDYSLKTESFLLLDPMKKTTIHNTGKITCEILFIQGKPINESFVHDGPFVAGTKAELRTAKEI